VVTLSLDVADFLASLSGLAAVLALHFLREHHDFYWVHQFGFEVVLK
jgi:hypothetical protein